MTRKIENLRRLNNDRVDYSKISGELELPNLVEIQTKSYEEFKEKIEEGGFILAHWDGTVETEEKIKEETKATIRCIPLEGDTTPGVCMVTGKPSARRVIFARAY
jgi:DNA-directed RNA polymerase beta subunit